MNESTSRRVSELRYLVWIAGITLVLVLLVNCIGCSSTNVARQIREMPNEMATLDMVKSVAVEKCNSNAWTPEQCDRIMQLITATGNAYNLYQNTLRQYLEGKTTQDAVTQAIAYFGSNMTQLVAVLQQFGIKIK